MLDCCICLYVEAPENRNEAVTIINGQSICLIHIGYMTRGDFGLLLNDVLEAKRNASK